MIIEKFAAIYKRHSKVQTVKVLGGKYKMHQKRKANAAEHTLFVENMSDLLCFDNFIF